MTVSTDIELANIRELVITREMVDLFRRATKDDNKIHQGEGAIALGYQMGGLLKAAADDEFAKSASEDDLGFRCSEQETHFKGPVAVDSEVGLYTPSALKKDGDDYVVTVGLRKTGESEPRAVSTVRYSKLLPSGTHREDGNAYWITAEAAHDVARGLAKSERDIETLVLGLASNALYMRGKKIVDRAAQQGKMPAYMMHTITPHNALFPDHADGVSIGDSIIIATDAGSVAEKISRAMKRSSGGVPERPYKVSVVATKPTGRTIYTAELRLVFTTPDQIRESA